MQKDEQQDKFQILFQFFIQDKINLKFQKKKSRKEQVLLAYCHFCAFKKFHFSRTHKYGYQNYDNDDHSKNTLPFDFLMLGELFQNNYHKHPNSPNFASRK